MSKSFDQEKKQKSPEKLKPVRLEAALLDVFFQVAKDNLKDYLTTRVEARNLSVACAFNKPDAKTDEAYSRI